MRAIHLVDVDGDPVMRQDFSVPPKPDDMSFHVDADDPHGGEEHETKNKLRTVIEVCFGGGAWLHLRLPEARKLVEVLPEVIADAEAHDKHLVAEKAIAPDEVE